METRSATIHRKMSTPARQLPITEFAHKAGNGRRPLPVATGTARSVRAQRHGNGSPSAKPSCCRCRTSTSCSRCRPRSPPSPIRTRPWSTTCCSRPRPRPLLTIAADPEHLGARIGITVGAAHLGLGPDPSSACPHDRAGRRHRARTGRGGCRAGPASFCRCGCSRKLFRRLFWRSCSPRTRPAA